MGQRCKGCCKLRSEIGKNSITEQKACCTCVPVLAPAEHRCACTCPLCPIAPNIVDCHLKVAPLPRPNTVVTSTTIAIRLLIGAETRLDASRSGRAAYRPTSLYAISSPLIPSTSTEDRRHRCSLRSQCSATSAATGDSLILQILRLIDRDRSASSMLSPVPRSVTTVLQYIMQAPGSASGATRLQRKHMIGIAYASWLQGLCDAALLWALWGGR